MNWLLSSGNMVTRGGSKLSVTFCRFKLKSFDEFPTVKQQRYWCFNYYVKNFCYCVTKRSLEQYLGEFRSFYGKYYNKYLENKIAVTGSYLEGIPEHLLELSAEC